LVPLAFAAAGCGEKAETVAPVFIATSPVVAWDDLVPNAGPWPEDDFRLLLTEPTEGLFPISLAVARVAAHSTLEDLATSDSPEGYEASFDPEATDTAAEPGEPEAHDEPAAFEASKPHDEPTAFEHPGEYELALDMNPPHDFLKWNSLFKDVRAVSAVFPISWVALDGREISARNMVKATEALTGRMCLVYAITDFDESYSEVKGVLYRVDTGEALATIHASGSYDLPYDEDPPTDAAQLSAPVVQLLAPRTPRLVAERRFQSRVRACMLKLLEQDQPVEPTPEEGWVPEGPLAPPLWPPIPPEWHLRSAPGSPYTNF
jgi:hypothetical protein